MCSLMFRRAFLSFLCMAVWAIAVSASAEIWGFIDEKGVGHFSATKLDDRYELFSKEVLPQQSAATSDPSESSTAHAEHQTARPVQPTVPTSTLSPKLAAFFESSQVLKNIRPIMQAAGQSFRLDIELLQALIAAESGFNVTAVSPKGALGLMQLMPATAARYGVRGDQRTSQQQKLFDPYTNIHAGSHYLRDLLVMFQGQLDLALAAYNAGEGAVQKAGNKIPNYPETQNYVRTVTQMYAALKPPPPPPPVQAPPIVLPEPKLPAGPDPLRPTKGRTNGLPLK